MQQTINYMPKQELTRLKQAFISNNPGKVPEKKNRPQLTISLLITFSISVAVIAFIISYAKKGRTTTIPTNQIAKESAKEITLSEGIESIFLIQGANKIKPLLTRFPVVISGSYPITLVLNLKKPLNIHKDSIEVYFDEAVDEIQLVLKDYLYFSNSQNPIKLKTDNKKSLVIGSDALSLNNFDLNLYRVNQLRFTFDSNSLPSIFKIQKIEVRKKNNIT